MTVIILAIGEVGGRLVARHEAQSAADAVALAAVIEGRERALAVAAANEVEVVSLSIEGTNASVVVRRLGTLADARASKGP